MTDLLDQYVSPRPELAPTVYAYSDVNYPGLLRVGYTTRGGDERVAEQYPVELPGGRPWKVVFREPAIRSDGSTFKDYEVHRALVNRGIVRKEGEWFACTPDQVRAAWVAVREGHSNPENRTLTFGMRPEQRKAVEKTAAYLERERAAGRIPRFLWNAKMRFGKTFAAYQLAKRLGYTKVLVLTFKPAVQSAWQSDLEQHVDFEGWQFVARPTRARDDGIDLQYQRADKSRPIVCFGSFQDFMGYDKRTKSIKPHNEWVHTTNWDLVIFDEYHFGAWRETAQALFDRGDEDEIADPDPDTYDRGNALNETWLPITAYAYLHLSGTPFRSLSSGEFIEEQVYSWTYGDEQRAKAAWVGPDNPYAALPRMVMLTYRIPEEITRIALQGEFNEFDLNLFFKASGRGKNAKFEHADDVQKWLDLIRGAALESATDQLRQGRGRPPMPFGDVRLLEALTHTLWLLPDVASCHAMANLLRSRQNAFFHDFNIVVAAGTKAGIGVAALPPVWEAMGDPLHSRTITLSCGKLTTGVTVPPWSGVFMLRNLKSPETYFQTAFRAQSPWVVEDENGKSEIIKHDCYLFDFALDRALQLLSRYASELNVSEPNPEKRVAEFIKFLPVLAYDGFVMKEVDAAGILDLVVSGTTSTLLAKRWESALLVNVTDEVLRRLLETPAALDALMRIEGFRSLNSDIRTIISKSEAVKNARKDGVERSPQELKHLSDEEKEYRSKRKEIQTKLIKFATRIPIFMYLTDFREHSLKDVITQLEPGLFKRVTGLEVKDFNLLCELNVFNAPLMNDAVYQFKRYEDDSLEYTGLPSRHKKQPVGLYDTVLSAEDYEELDRSRQAGMVFDGYLARELPDAPPPEVSDEDEDEDEDKAMLVVRSPRACAQSEDALESLSAPSASAPAPQVKASSSAAHQPPPAPPVAKPAAPVAPARLHVVVDTSGVAEGTPVYHRSFGRGVVSAIEGDIIRVDFGAGFKVKAFIFPAAFSEGFLHLSEPSLSSP